MFGFGKTAKEKIQEIMYDFLQQIPVSLIELEKNKDKLSGFLSEKGYNLEDMKWDWTDEEESEESILIEASDQEGNKYTIYINESPMGYLVNTFTK